MLEEAPLQPDGSAAQETYYFHQEAAGVPAVRRILPAGDRLPHQYDLLLMPSAEREVPGSLLVRRVSRTEVPGGVVEHFNHHRPQFTSLMLSIIEAQTAMTPEEVAAYSKLRQASSAVLAGHTLLLVGGLLYVPPGAEAVRNMIFDRVLHCDGTLHAGLAKARVLVRKHGLYIGGNFDDLYQAFYSSCKCQHARVPAAKREVGTLVPTPRFQALEHVYADMLSLPMSSAGHVGACIVVDPASRAATITPVRNLEAGSAILALKDWASRWQWPSVIHSDGGPCFDSKAFKAFAAGHGIVVDIGTPEHPRGRGQVESLVGLFKRAIKGILPQGQLDSWHEILEDLMIAYMASPQVGMGGYSPFEYLVALPPKRFGALFQGPLSPQAREDALLAVECVRGLVDCISELDAVKRAADSIPDPHMCRFVEGAWVLVYQPSHKANSLEPLYQGPYRITLREQDLTGAPTGWFTVREIYAGDSEATPREGPPLELHSSRMWPFDHTRTTAAAEHARRLPLGMSVVEGILEGPNEDGQFLVKWHAVAEPRWEWPAGLAHLTLFDEYCKEHNVVLVEGRPHQWRPSSLRGAPVAPLEDPDRHKCTCGKMVRNTSVAIKQHVASQYHIANADRGIALSVAPAPEGEGIAPLGLQPGGITAPPMVGGGAAPQQRRTTPRARVGQP